MLLSSDLGPISRRPALIVVKSQISPCLQQSAEQPRVTGEHGGVDRSASVITAAKKEKTRLALLSRTCSTVSGVHYYVQSLTIYPCWVIYSVLEDRKARSAWSYRLGSAPYWRSSSATAPNPSRDAQKRDVWPRWFTQSTSTPERRKYRIHSALTAYTHTSTINYKYINANALWNSLGFTLLEELLCFLQVSLPGELVQSSRHTSGFDGAQAYGTGHNGHARHLSTSTQPWPGYLITGYLHHTLLFTVIYSHTLLSPLYLNYTSALGNSLI